VILRRKPAVILLAAAVAVYAVACLLTPLGLLATGHGADVGLYHADARRIVDGGLPYRDVYLEYPPFALPAFLVPALDFGHYAFVFKLSMALCGACALLVVFACLRNVGATLPRIALALALVAVAPAALGSPFLNRYDAWPTLVAVAALLFLLRDRPSASAALLAAGTAAKIFPLALVPAAAVDVARRFTSTALRRTALVLVVVGAVLILPFAALGPGGLAFSFYVQATRHLQVESLFGSILLAADRSGVYDAHLATGKPGSLDVFGRLPTALGVLSTILEVAAVLGVAYLYARGRPTKERLLAAAAASIAAYVALGKVISPQYLVWLVPFVPLAGGRLGRAATLLLLAALVLTNLEFRHYASLAHVGPVVWLLLARNLVLLALLLVLAAQVGARAAAAADSRVAWAAM
jgi:hypothetical protein